MQNARVVYPFFAFVLMFNARPPPPLSLTHTVPEKSVLLLSFKMEANGLNSVCLMYNDLQPFAVLAVYCLCHAATKRPKCIKAAHVDSFKRREYCLPAPHIVTQLTPLSRFRGAIWLPLCVYLLLVFQPNRNARGFLFQLVLICL